MKSRVIITLILFAAFYLLSFSLVDKGEKISTINDSESGVVLTSKADQETLIVLRTNCYVCHNPKAESHDDILAPPLAGIKYRYKKSYPDRENFITHMTEYILNPSEDKAIMKGPVRKFGIMPNTVLTETDIKEVVTYIYDNKLEEPSWFADHFEEKHGEKWKQ